MKFLSKATMISERKGFTIIELLVAVGVTALMVSLMLTIVVNVLGGWNRSSGSLASGNQARLVLDQISKDIQSAIIKRDGNGWMVATVQQNQTGVGSAGVSDADWVAIKPSDTGTNPSPTPPDTVSFLVPSGTNPALDDYRFGQGGVYLRFFSAVTGSNAYEKKPDGTDDLTRPLLQTISAPRAVSYQIVRLPVVKSSPELRYQLFRSEVRPGHRDATLAGRSTFSTGYNLLDSSNAYNLPSVTNSGVLINSSGVDEGGEPGSIRRPDRNQLIANNVIDFGVRVKANNTILFPVSTTNIGFAVTTKDGTNGTTAAAPAGYSYGFPDTVEVFVRVLTDEGVLQISNLEAGLTPNTQGKWWEIALANSRVYTRRIEVKGNGL
jgi:type II secretory pathway pseudopilin PulG